MRNKLFILFVTFTLFSSLVQGQVNKVDDLATIKGKQVKFISKNGKRIQTAVDNILDNPRASDTIFPAILRFHKDDILKGKRIRSNIDSHSLRLFLNYFEKIDSEIPDFGKFSKKIRSKIKSDADYCMMPFSSTILELNNETKTTQSGHVFTRRNDIEKDLLAKSTNIKFSGEIWQEPKGEDDEEGLIWFDTSDVEMDSETAKKYCKDRGARLPTKEEFITLREYMGAKKGLRKVSRQKNTWDRYFPNSMTVGFCQALLINTVIPSTTQVTGAILIVVISIALGALFAV